MLRYLTNLLDAREHLFYLVVGTGNECGQKFEGVHQPSLPTFPTVYPLPFEPS